MDLREKLAACQMALSAAKANHGRLRLLHKRINEIREELRAKGAYETADALRDALDKFQPYP